MRLENFEGDMYWVADDPEDMVDDPEGFMEECQPGAVITFQQAQSLSNFYGANDPSGKYEFFTDKEEAEKFSTGKKG